MKSAMHRWKMVPSYSGVPDIFWRVFGWVHSFSPVANPTKVSTVLGASFAKSFTPIAPSLVSKVAYKSWPARAASIIRPIAVRLLPTVGAAGALLFLLAARALGSCVGGNALRRLVGDLHFLDHHRIVGLVPPVARQLADLHHHVVTLDDLAKDGVAVGEVWRGGDGDEELRAIGVRS